MANLSLLRNHLRLNANVITSLHVDVLTLKSEVKAWKEQKELAFMHGARIDLAKARAKLAKAVETQKRIKVEIATYFRELRIEAKFLKLFGFPLNKGSVFTDMTTFEIEQELDEALLARKRAAAGDVVNTPTPA